MYKHLNAAAPSTVWLTMSIIGVVNTGAAIVNGASVPDILDSVGPWIFILNAYIVGISNFKSIQFKIKLFIDGRNLEIDVSIYLGK